PPGSAPTGDTLPGSAPTGDTLPGSAPTGDTRFGDAPLSAGPLSAGAGGRIRFIEADLRDPASILTHPQFKETVDLSRPVALILIAVLHLIPDQDRSREIVHELLAALPSGSYLAATSLTLDFGAADTLEPITGPRSPVRPRTRDEFAEFFTGLGLIGPGIVPVSEWLPEVPAHQRPPADQVATYGALGRKP
ncbi:SAM-dependent methyltransferase, partial [Actinoplanes utahensis]